MSAAKDHGRVEAARQRLVEAEEKYLSAHGWMHIKIGSDWWWSKKLLSSQLTMTRSEAAKFQHSYFGDS